VSQADDFPYRPIGEVLSGIEVKVLPEGYMPLEVGLMIKTLDPDGDVCWVNRWTRGPHSIEFLGALHAAILTMGNDIVQAYVPDGEND
jgi:hypothetical protein